MDDRKYESPWKNTRKPLKPIKRGFKNNLDEIIFMWVPLVFLMFMIIKYGL
jgi:hypothetical protein